MTIVVSCPGCFAAAVQALKEGEKSTRQTIEEKELAK